MESPSGLVPFEDDDPASLLAVTDDELEALQATVDRSMADNTRRAYAIDYETFTAFSASRGIFDPIPAAPITVALYLRYLADVGNALATIKRRKSSLSTAHRLAGVPPERNPTRDPLVERTMAGLTREMRGEQQRQAAPLLLEDLREIMLRIDRESREKVEKGAITRAEDDLVAVRDRAMLLVGTFGAFRRSELVALDIADFTVVTEGLEVYLAWSKTDQEGAGAVIGLPYAPDVLVCPVRAWVAWQAQLTERGITSGPAFREARWGRIGPDRLGDDVASKMLARRAKAAGRAGAFSGHSMRAGFATEAFDRGVPETLIMKHGRWSSPVVMARYQRPSTVWKQNAVSRFWK